MDNQYFLDLIKWFGDCWYIDGNTIKRDIDGKILKLEFKVVEEQRYPSYEKTYLFYKVFYYLDDKPLLNKKGDQLIFRYTPNYFGWSPLVNRIFKKLEKSELVDTKKVNFDSILAMKRWVSEKITIIRYGEKAQNKFTGNNTHISVDATLPTDIALKVLELINAHKIN